MTALCTNPVSKCYGFLKGKEDVRKGSDLTRHRQISALALKRSFPRWRKSGLLRPTRCQ